MTVSAASEFINSSSCLCFSVQLQKSSFLSQCLDPEQQAHLLGHCDVADERLVYFHSAGQRKNYPLTLERCVFWSYHLWVVWVIY